MTNDLLRRVAEHRFVPGNGFSKQYYLKDLVYFEETDDVTAAISREKQLENRHRDGKINLVRSSNPLMEDLAKGWFDEENSSSGDPETRSG